MVRQQPVPRSDFVQQLDLEAEDEEDGQSGAPLPHGWTLGFDAHK